MKFSNIKLREFKNVYKHTPTVRRWQTNGRQTHILGIQLSGNNHHKMEKGTITLTENTLFFFNMKDDFSATVREFGESYTVHFTTWEPVETDSFSVKAQSPREAVSLLEGVERALYGNGGENEAMSEFYKLCSLIEGLRSVSYHPTDSRVDGALEYMKLHFKERGALSLAAKITGLSRRRFNDLFKRQHGQTPNGYITQLKVNAAKAYLLDNSLSVKKIAEMCGFEDHFYFCKVFKKITGVSPTAFRRGAIKHL